MNRFVRAPLACAALLIPGAAAHAAETAADGSTPCNLRADFTQPQWRLACDTAIVQETDAEQRAEFLRSRAYVAVEQYRYEDALGDLNAALAGHPDCANCLHERAYLNGELGEYAAAIADLDREIALQPRAAAFRERAYARGLDGDLEGAYQDRVREQQLEPSSGALQARGTAAQWLGRFDAAAADFAEAEKLAKQAGDEEARASAARSREELALWRASVGERKAAKRCVMQALVGSDPKVKKLIGDCTQAFLRAKDDAAKAEALTTRSSLWALHDAGDFERATIDSRVAVGLDPGNPDLRVNLGYNFLQTGHSWAARREFERALATKRSYLALAGRAQARANLDDPDGAFADAKASYEIEPNSAALWVLGDLVYEKGDKDGARRFYLGAYKLGLRDERLIAKLKELGVDDPAKAELK